MFTYLDNKIQQTQAHEERLRPSGRKPFLQHIHYFRGFAIVNIVMIHLLFPYLMEHVEDFKYVRLISDLLFIDSTIYFVLISGFLFSYLAFKINVGPYYLVKFKNVILPYLFITLTVTFLKEWPLLRDMNFSGFFHIFLDFALWGTALEPFWYIPLIGIIFLISPLFLTLSDKNFARLTLILALLPLLGTRPTIEITFWHFVYYVPVYMLGMLFARNYEKMLFLVSKYMFWLYFGAIFSSILLLYITLLKENTFAFQINVMHGIFYIQKMCISVLLLNFLRRFDNEKINWLDYLAVYSFSIYFLHALVQIPVLKIMYYAPLRPFIDQFSSFYIVFVAVMIIFVTLLISMLLKHLLGRYSRMFIGA